MPDIIIEILGEDDFDVRDKLPARIREALASANNKICSIEYRHFPIKEKAWH